MVAVLCCNVARALRNIAFIATTGLRHGAFFSMKNKLAVSEKNKQQSDMFIDKYCFSGPVFCVSQMARFVLLKAIIA